jgi:hypothetical protein
MIGILGIWNPHGRPAPENSSRNHCAILCSCARASPIDNALFREEVERITDWDQLLAFAAFHGLTPLLAAAIEKACPDAVPAQVHRSLIDTRREAVVLNLLFSNELTRLLAVFGQNGISVLPLKGPVLAEALYADPALRPCSDLDLLVRPQDVSEVLCILQREKYELEPHLARLSVPALLDWGVEAPLRHGQGTQIDLHWAIAPRDYPFYFDADVLWNSVRPARLGGKDVFSVAPETLLVFLCAHGTKHMWSRLIWLVDVDRLTCSKLNWAEAFGLATRTGCERPLLLGLLLAHEELGTVVPAAYLERAQGERVIGSLAEHIKRRHGTSMVDPSTLELAPFFVRLADHWWDAARHCAGLLRAPTDVELRWLSLPQKLFLLYYPLRLGRLIARYGTRLVRSR